MTEDITLEVTLTVTQQRIEDLLCGAFEGGSNYWCSIKEFTYPVKEDGTPHTQESLGIEHPYIELPFKGGSITIVDVEGEDTKEYILDREACIRGLNVMSKMYNHHFADWLSEDDDSTTADVYLQCCLFGEIVYG